LTLLLGKKLLFVSGGGGKEITSDRKEQRPKTQAKAEGKRSVLKMRKRKTLADSCQRVSRREEASASTNRKLDNA